METINKGENGMAKDVGKRLSRKKEPEAPKREGERVNVGFRITPSVRKMLEQAASKNGRSLSQEMEVRLERSFDYLNVAGDALRLAYGPVVAKAMFQFADTMRTKQVVREMVAKGAMTEEQAQAIFPTCDKQIADLAKLDPGTLEEVR